MTKIRKRAFVNRIVEYLTDADSFCEGRFDASLFSVVKELRGGGPDDEGVVRQVELIQGLRFGAHIELVMLLLAHAFHGLDDQTTIEVYAEAMAGAMQSFAEPIANGSLTCFPDPTFLLHGLGRATLADVVRRFENNGRIIHETLARRDDFIGAHGRALCMGHGVKMLMEEGAAEDSFGICGYLVHAEEENPHGTDISYIAKTSFFLDATQSELFVISLQGQRVLPAQKERSRDFARLAARLAMDPRAFVLRKVCEVARGEGYRRVRVVRPDQHPMFLDRHRGFMGRYEPIILQAGIGEENGCYLEASL
ncbi:MAG: hypothetical protein OEV73_03750 [Desulfobulbaceae bacterium]|nr:hypothetical protein [Desulfobulbaceae bacterium]